MKKKAMGLSSKASQRLLGYLRVKTQLEDGKLAKKCGTTSSYLSQIDEGTSCFKVKHLERIEKNFPEFYPDEFDLWLLKQINCKKVVAVSLIKGAIAAGPVVVKKGKAFRKITKKYLQKGKGAIEDLPEDLERLADDGKSLVVDIQRLGRKKLTELLDHLAD